MTPPPKAPEATPPTAETPAKPRLSLSEAFAVDGPVREEWLPLLKAPVIDPAKEKLPAPPAELAPPPASCDAFVKRAPQKPAPACADESGALAALAAALGPDDAARRDAMLAALEGCKGLPAGIVRAIRAELAPIECADVLVEPVLKSPDASMSGNVYYALSGQAIAARLARSGANPPKLDPPYSRKRVSEFTNGPMANWFAKQAAVIQEISQAAASLPHYAKGIAGIEAGVAEMRLVDTVRSSPLPDDIAKDPELRNVYYGSLDQGLDPRKDRGRDAALVGLRELAMLGILHDARVDRARKLLSKLYGGRRVDALDALLLPPLPSYSPATVEEQLAGKLPTFYAGILLDKQAGTRVGSMRMFLERGVPLPQRIVLRDAELSPEVRALYARAHLEIGRLYWRGVDFDLAAQLLSKWPEGTERPKEATFLLALAIGLRHGPEDAVEMMRKAPRPFDAMGKVDALDYVAEAKEVGALSGMAAFDAAFIKQIAAPEGASAAYWNEVAARFEKAASLLSEPSQRATASDFAKAASELAAAIK